MVQLTRASFKKVPADKFNSDVISRPTITYWQDAWSRLKKNPIAMFGLVLLFICFFMALFAPMLRGLDYVIINAKAKNLSPNSEFWFGTDALGRDMFSRIWVGAKVSLMVAMVCTFIQITVGCTIGGIMAYFGGWIDEVLMRIVEIITSIPSLLITLLVMMVLDKSLFSLIFAMCITAWCGTARQMRGQIMQLRESEYVMAAETLGASPSRIIIKHLIPNTLSILVLNVASSIPRYIFNEASLSFLGMGLESPSISLGVLISEGKIDLYPYQLFFPALILCIIVLAFNLLGDGLRDALDPRLRQ